MLQNPSIGVFIAFNVRVFTMRKLKRTPETHFTNGVWAQNLDCVKHLLIVDLALKTMTGSGQTFGGVCVCGVCVCVCVGGGGGGGGHYSDIIIGLMASQITSLTIAYSTVYSDADQSIHQSSASLAFVREFPAQMAGNAENVSTWWSHHGEGGF